MFKLFFVNHGYSPDWVGKTFEEAVEQAKKFHFSASIICDGFVVGAWDAIGGVKDYRDTPYLIPAK